MFEHTPVSPQLTPLTGLFFFSLIFFVTKLLEHLLPHSIPLRLSHLVIFPWQPIVYCEFVWGLSYSINSPPSDPRLYCTLISAAFFFVNPLTVFPGTDTTYTARHDKSPPVSVKVLSISRLSPVGPVLAFVRVFCRVLPTRAPLLLLMRGMPFSTGVRNGRSPPST